MQLQESPDLVKLGDRPGASWYDKDSLSFGFFAEFPGSPAVLGVKDGGGSLTHFWAWNTLQRWAHDKGEYTISDFGFTIPALKGQVVMPEINSEDLLAPLQRYIRELRASGHGELGWNARQMMWPCGRIWTKQRITSFWTGRRETPRGLVEKLFTLLALDSAHYIVEFKGEYKVPFALKGTVAQFLAGAKGPKASRNLDRELMQIQHVSPPAKKALAPAAPINPRANLAQKAGFNSVAQMGAMLNQESLADSLLA